MMYIVSLIILDFNIKFQTTCVFFCFGADSRIIVPNNNHLCDNDRRNMPARLSGDRARRALPTSSTTSDASTSRLAQTGCDKTRLRVDQLRAPRAAVRRTRRAARRQSRRSTAHCSLLALLPAFARPVSSRASRPLCL